MSKRRTRNGLSIISAVFILSILLSSCATATPVIPVEIQPFTAQGQVDIPGGLMEVEDGFGDLHPAVLFDFQIQSQLVSQLEYAACVEAGACEPAGDLLYPAAPAGVTWYQAQNYCSYLGGRLPTEAELSRATQSSEDCPGDGSELIIQEGFGEWVYDWDDPDYYNRSLTTNPFGPMYGDLKVAVGLDLDAVTAVIGKYWIKWGDLKLDEIKLDEIKIEEIKIEEIKIEEIKLEEIKLAEIKFDMYKFFTKDDWQFTKDDWNYTIGVEDGKWFISTDAAGHDKWDPGEGALFPRMGVLPDSSNPLIGFRCVTEGAALTYAPICKTETTAKCSPPAEQMESISAQLTMEGSVNPNFQIVGANCPQGDTYDITISHELPTVDGVEIKSGGKECECLEYAEYPGKLYCDCPSPGAGLKTEINVCAAFGETLIAMDDFCPSGSRFDIQSFTCVVDQFEPPALFSLIGEGDGSGASACPSGPGLPLPQYGPLSLAVTSLPGVGESELPEADQWELFSVSDGSGMCPPGYAYNDDTGCCSPYSDENYNCASDEYFDAGLKRCLPVGWDGCGPCSDLGPSGQCEIPENHDMLGGRCNTGNEEPVARDEPGRSPESSSGCDSDAYLDPNLGMCVETDDGCALGYFLDPKTGRCRPISGPESPCTDGYAFSSLTRCCQPLPGVEGSELPIGSENIDDAFPSIAAFAESGGCPTTHFYEEESDSCRLRVGGECPGGTTKNLIGRCIPDIPGECPDGRDFEPTSGSCPPNAPDPATCAGNKVFDPSIGYCSDIQYSLGGRTGGGCDVEDLETVDTVDEDTPEMPDSCADASSLNFVIETVDSPDGRLHCLILTADKSFRSSQGFCRPQSEGDEKSEHFFTVEFETGRVASITRISPDVIEPATATEPPNEAVTFCYSDYVFGPGAESGKADDDWSDPASGGLPGEDECIPKLFIDAGSVLAPRKCTTFATTVPVCAAPVPSSGGGGNICTGLNQNACVKLAGCGWAGQCVKCSSQPFNMCDNTQGCHWDLTNATCVTD